MEDGEIDARALEAEFNSQKEAEPAAQTETATETAQPETAPATPEVDPLQETLPAGHWGIQDGVKTWKDLDDRYRAGSTEVRKWQQEAETKARLVEGYQELIARMEDRKSTRLNSSHIQKSRMPSSA